MENRKDQIINSLQAFRDSPFPTVIYGVSGSVAAIKAREIAELLLSKQFNVALIATKSALHFLNIGEYALTGVKAAYPAGTGKPMLIEFTDEDEWSAWKGRADPVLHIELRRIGAALLIAPLSANTLGKLANGLCDNLLTSVARCWDLKSGLQPLVVAPAMNTMMYEHPITEMQLELLQTKLRVKVLPTAFKVLMCGEEGYGALLDPENIVKELLAAIEAAKHCQLEPSE